MQGALELSGYHLGIESLVMVDWDPKFVSSHITGCSLKHEHRTNLPYRLRTSVLRTSVSHIIVPGLSCHQVPEYPSILLTPPDINSQVSKMLLFARWKLVLIITITNHVPHSR